MIVTINKSELQNAYTPQNILNIFFMKFKKKKRQTSHMAMQALLRKDVILRPRL